MQDRGLYHCPHCGEPIEIALDPSAAREQEYVEDCPVCCRPNVIHVRFVSESAASVEAWPE